MNNFAHIYSNLNGVRQEAARSLSTGKARRVSNYLDKALALMKRNTLPATEEKQSAKEAIFQALCSGRHISQLNSREFKIEDVRTPVSHLGKRIDAAGLKLCKKRITSPVTGAWIYEYWCEKHEAV